MTERRGGADRGLARQDSARVLALLARRFGDVDLADEAVQDGLLEAARTWAVRGVPTNPAGWLLAVARRKAIDRLRRTDSAKRRTLAAAPDLTRPDEDARGGACRHGAEDDDTIGDERLRLVLLCCHPALAPDTQMALTLRLVGGLTTAEVAAAFLQPEPTLAQRIVRAKRKIRDAGIPLSIPANLDERIDVVLGVLYLIFNEGYLTRAGSDEVVRVDLCDEAARLTRVLLGVVPGHAEITGLLALQRYCQARQVTRTDAAGDLVLLEAQDRSRWDRAAIAEGNYLVRTAMAKMQPGPYQVQALIAAHHANARTAATTDWPAIATLYGQFAGMTHSPVVELNRAVATAMANGPQAGLAVLAGVAGLDNYHLLHATRAELLVRAGDPSAAREAFLRARQLTDNPAEQRHLDRRLASLA